MPKKKIEKDASLKEIISNIQTSPKTKRKSPKEELPEKKKSKLFPDDLDEEMEGNGNFLSKIVYPKRSGRFIAALACH